MSPLNGKRTTTPSRTVLRGLLAGSIGLALATTVQAGSFIGSLGANSALSDQDFILHPKGYLNDAQNGLVSDVNVKLCIVPGTPNASDMVVSVANIANTMTQKIGRTGNLLLGNSGDAVPFTQWDFESVALHEVGHCLGLAHVNAATESGLGAADREYTKAAAGANNTLNLGIGADGIRGSADDIRSDDVNVHWFRIGSNDPCNAPGTSTFDTSTFTVAGSLPAGDTFAANAEQSVCADLGAANTEAIMQQGSPNGQSQRFLGHSGEAMLRLAMSGLDETQGTSDDYTLTVESLGISNSSDCDINISFNNAQTGFAVCQVSWLTFFDPDNHGVIASANSYFNTDAVTWFFNTTSNMAGFSVGGNVTGLSGSGLVLQNNGGNDLAIGSNGSFTFTLPVEDGEDYAVTVDTQPTSPSQTCSVSSGSGTISGADVTNVAVDCVTDTFTVGGSVNGLSGSGLVLQNNAGDDLAIGANGGFTFDTALDDGSGYAVTVKTQPSGPAQTCAVSNASGTLDGANVTNVTVNCVTAGFTIGGSVSGLAGTGLVLQNNGGDDLAINSNGSFTFGTPITNGAGYAVTVSVQPGSPNQSCLVSNDSGTVSGANVTNVSVVCTTTTYTVSGTVAGLLGSGLVLQNNGGDNQAIAGNGPFSFSPQADGSDFLVTVLTQPGGPAQTCSVANGSGTLSGGNFTNVFVNCQLNCLTNVVSGVTDTGTIDHEACETLVVGPNYTAEDGADVNFSSGSGIEIFPNTLIEEGATGRAQTCGQSLCDATSDPLDASCHSCAQAVCAVDAFCCGDGGGFWDEICVDRVSVNCNLACE